MITDTVQVMSPSARLLTRALIRAAKVLLAVKQLGVDFADYWAKFDARYETAVQAAFEGAAPLAGLRAGLIYSPEIRSAAATAGYELEVSPAEAVGLMVVLQAHAFTQRHGPLSRLLRPSLRGRARGHESMLKVVSPLVGHLRQGPIFSAFMDRTARHFMKDIERARPTPASQ